MSSQCLKYALSFIVRLGSRYQQKTNSLKRQHLDRSQENVRALMGTRESFHAAMCLREKKILQPQRPKSTFSDAALIEYRHQRTGPRKESSWR
jgi:hypothetical protein